MSRLSIIGVVAVAACVGSCARTWSRPGADAADLEREKFECQFEASKANVSAEAQAPVSEAFAWRRAAGRDHGGVEGGERTPRADFMAIVRRGRTRSERVPGRLRCEFQITDIGP
jgi:hypothetical protein